MLDRDALDLGQSEEKVDPDGGADDGKDDEGPVGANASGLRAKGTVVSYSACTGKRHGSESAKRQSRAGKQGVRTTHHVGKEPDKQEVDEILDANADRGHLRMRECKRAIRRKVDRLESLRNTEPSEARQSGRVHTLARRLFGKSSLLSEKAFGAQPRP